jgi:hypothetical protein
MWTLLYLLTKFTYNFIEPRFWWRNVIITRPCEIYQRMIDRKALSMHIFMSEKNQPWTLNYVNTTAHHARLSSNFDSLTNNLSRTSNLFYTSPKWDLLYLRFTAKMLIRTIIYIITWGANWTIFILFRYTFVTILPAWIKLPSAFDICKKNKRLYIVHIVLSSAWLNTGILPNA